MIVVWMLVGVLVYIFTGCVALAYLDEQLQGRLLPWWEESPIPTTKWLLWPVVVAMYWRSRRERHED